MRGFLIVFVVGLFVVVVGVFVEEMLEGVFVEGMIDGNVDVDEGDGYFGGGLDDEIDGVFEVWGCVEVFDFEGVNDVSCGSIENRKVRGFWVRCFGWGVNLY